MEVIYTREVCHMCGKFPCRLAFGAHFVENELHN